MKGQMMATTAKQPPKRVVEAATILLIVGCGGLIVFLLMVPAVLFVHWALVPSICVLVGAIGSLIIRRDLLRGLRRAWRLIVAMAICAAAVFMVVIWETITENGEWPDLVFPGMILLYAAILAQLLSGIDEREWLQGK
jgi:hypothetical protein